MSDEKDQSQVTPAQSERSAHDDELADSLSIEDATGQSEAAAEGPTDDVPADAPTAVQRDDAVEPPIAAEPPATQPTEPQPTAPQPAAAGAAPTPVEATAAKSSADRRAERRGARQARRSKGSRRKAPWWELPLLVAAAIVIAILVKTFVVQPFYIPSASMEKTLYGATHGGDRILVNKPIYDLRDPHPGDIVVFNAPPGWDDEPGTTPPANPVLKTIRGFGQLIGFVPPDGEVLVKRVIATGGQTVKGVSTDGGVTETVEVSDHGDAGPWRVLNEPFVYMPSSDPMANFGPVTVPKGRLWVMGDHRNDSADSRYHCGPDGSQAPDGSTCDPVTSTVPINNVIGKATVIAWPPSRWRTLGTPSTFKHDAAALAASAPVVESLPLLGSVLLLAPVYVARRRRRRQP